MKVWELTAKLTQYNEDADVHMDYGGEIMEIDEVYEDEEGEFIYIG